MSVLDIIDRHEIPEEYHDAVWEAYQEGAKRGFINAYLEGNDLHPSDSDKQTEATLRRKDEA